VSGTVFERDSEHARRALFFARYEVTQIGGTTIEPEHLVLGVLRDSPGAVLRFARSEWTVESLRAKLAAAAGGKETVPTSVEIPFSAAAKDALQQTPLEADAAGNQWIRPEHVVLAVLVKSSGVAARVLEDAGVDADAIREHLANTAEDPRSAPPESRLPRPGMISRQWKGVVKPGRIEEYLSHLRRTTFPALARLEGFLNAAILRREVEDGTEVQVITLWRSLAAIAAFAGDEVTRAVVPPEAAAKMVGYDDHAVHYEIVQ
jgi:ATP-dependent Clp protease ATP-binding subunit ClpA